MLIEPGSAVQAEAAAIVASGPEFQPQLTETVALAAANSHQTGENFVQLVKAVLAGVREGFERAVPRDPDDALCQVVDAVGDGLARAALAGRLAIEEAGGSYRQFTGEDLGALCDDLKAVESMFTETVGRAFTGCKAFSGNQVTCAVTHASRVAERLQPAFARVFEAARRHPIVLAREGVQAGIGAGQGAAGALFQALGRLLMHAGNELAGRERLGSKP